MKARNLLRYGLVAVAMGLVVLAIANLALGDKRIDVSVEHLYAASSPQFSRAMDAMLGPSLVGGNDAKALVNQPS